MRAYVQARVPPPLCCAVRSPGASGLRRQRIARLADNEQWMPGDAGRSQQRASGFDLARRLSGTVILTSTHAQSEYAEEIAASPAAGFIPKTQLSAPAVLRLAGGPTD
jgi:hypothetical protein